MYQWISPSNQTVRNALIAAVAGAIVGTIAGFATISRRTTTAVASTTFVQSVPVPAAAPSVTAPSSPAKAPGSEQATTTIDRRTVLERARDFSDRADVAALLALREEVSRRAVSGQPESSTARELEAIDRYITAARLNRLKLDGEAFQKRNSP